MELPKLTHGIDRLMEIARQRQAEAGDPKLGPAPRQCSCCKEYYPVDQFPRLPPTDLTKGAIDAVCAKCSQDYAKELKGMWRLLCGGCNEVVGIREPEKAKAGFAFEAGKSYHVAGCPICVSPPPKQSQILEMVMFYRARGIPYD